MKLIRKCVLICRYSYDSEQFVDNQIPVLVIGTKQDLVMEVYPPGRTKRTASIAEECGADEIYVVRHVFSFSNFKNI